MLTFFLFFCSCFSKTSQSFFFSCLQIHTAIQQSGFKRVKRGFRTLKEPAAISNYPEPEQVVEDTRNIPTDPYFPLQWYLRNTGQNGGKPRLDLNVQAAWDQGITGKNVTTAIMDDGKSASEERESGLIFGYKIEFSHFFFNTFSGVDYMHPDLKFNYVSRRSVEMMECQ